MNFQTVTSTDIQRGFRSILDHLSDPVVVMRDSRPAAVVVDYEQYLRMTRLEEQGRVRDIEKMLKNMRTHNARIPASDVKKDVDKALATVRGRR